VALTSQPVARPNLACEITPDQVIAARRARNNSSLEACSSYVLPAGSLAPGLSSTNIADREALQEAVSTALGEVSDRSRDVIAIVPDAAIRVVLLDFDTLPEKRQDADAMVRFRLKKSLPFDVEQSAVSYDVMARDGQVKVLAAVCLRTVLDEYESIFRDAGYLPGMVIPSMFAALGTLQADEPTMVLKVDAMTSTLAIVRANQLLLFRTLENPPAGRESGEQLAEDIYPSLVFFEDNYSLQVRRILVGGRVAASAVGPALQAQSGAQVMDLIPETSSVTGNVPAAQMAGVLGALI
jgi:type IV pilus assembly protein PilM